METDSKAVKKIVTMGTSEAATAVTSSARWTAAGNVTLQARIVILRRVGITLWKNTRNATTGDTMMGTAALMIVNMNLKSYLNWGFGVLGFWGFGEIGRAHV